MTAVVEVKRQVLAATVASQVTDYPKTARLANALANNFKSTVVDSLERTKNLAYQLYVQDRPDLCLQVCQLLNDLIFTHNYNIWTWVALTLALEWKLQTQAGELIQAQRCAAILRSTYELSDPVAQAQGAKNLAWRINGGLRYDDQIAQAVQRGDTTAEKSYRQLQLGALLCIQALGGSATLPLPELERQLVFQLAKLRNS
jgi:hypothetical protein